MVLTDSGFINCSVLDENAPGAIIDFKLRLEKYQDFNALGKYLKIFTAKTDNCPNQQYVAGTGCGAATGDFCESGWCNQYGNCGPG